LFLSIQRFVKHVEELRKFWGGYSLEFDSAALLNCSFVPNADRVPFKMNYCGELTGTAKAMIDKIAAFGQKASEHAMVAGAVLSLMHLKFKHPAFQEEREWRLVPINPELSAIRFRQGYSDIKPYVEVTPDMADGRGRLPLKRIVFGPTLRNDGVVAEVIALMLEHYGYSNVLVEPSNIPYRL
jgi:hypothetical protein